MTLVVSCLIFINSLTEVINYDNVKICFEKNKPVLVKPQYFWKYLDLELTALKYNFRGYKSF